MLSSERSLPPNQIARRRSRSLTTKKDEKRVWDKKKREWKNLIVVKPKPYRFTLKEINWHKCNDCGINVIKIGDYCLIDPKIWEDTLGLKWRDNLCIECIEARLGRKLERRDLMSPPQVAGFWMSTRLRNRYPSRKNSKLPRRYGPRVRR